MTTYQRLCIRSHTIGAENGDVMTVERGREYLTSAVKNGTVMVFGTYWVRFPAELFAGPVQFTE